ncbi:hypothetical protein CFP56_019067 [Quercus suber]|uniref:Uncharacterized protein n=1 Tax=Quercus suber TaxID=58331 RepID=A0AAW0KK55_QUESU
MFWGGDGGCYAIGPEKAIDGINNFEGVELGERGCKRVKIKTNVHHWDSLKGLNRGVSVELGFKDRHSCAVEKPVTVYPPSTQITCPVIYEAAGRQRNATTDEISLGSAIRPRGVRAINLIKSLA